MPSLLGERTRYETIGRHQRVPRGVCPTAHKTSKGIVWRRTSYRTSVLAEMATFFGLHTRNGMHPCTQNSGVLLARWKRMLPAAKAAVTQNHITPSCGPSLILSPPQQGKESLGFLCFISPATNLCYFSNSPRFPHTKMPSCCHTYLLTHFLSQLSFTLSSFGIKPPVCASSPPPSYLISTS